MKKTMMLVVITFTICADERSFIDTMNRYVPMTENVKNTLYAMVTPSTKSYMKDTRLVDRPLYSAYPALQQTLPHIQLGDLPTPIMRLPHLENHFNNNGTFFL